jgi:hypothetical protein
MHSDILKQRIVSSIARKQPTASYIQLNKQASASRKDRAMASQPTPLVLRGIGIPINDLTGMKRMRSSQITNGSGFHHQDKFDSAVLGWEGLPTTVMEKTMTAFMGEITDKPEWTRKVFDDIIVSKWRAERAHRATNVQVHEVFTDEMFDYVCVLHQTG